MSLSRRPADRRRLVALVVLACLSLGSLAGLAGGLVSSAPPASVDPRPLTPVETKRLADMRVTNYRDGRVALRASYGTGDAEVRVAGWVDWTRAVTYLRVGGPGAGDRRGLLQAVPGMIATRPEAEAEVSAPTDPAQPVAPVAMPDPSPPATGWALRQWVPSGPKAAPLDAFLSLLFVVASTKPDPADLMARTESRWLGKETIDGTSVDMLLGPAVPPQRLPTSSPTASAPGRRSATPTKTAPARATSHDTSPDPESPDPESPDPESPRPGSKRHESTKAPGGTPSPSGTPARTAPPTALAELGGGVRYWLDDASKLHRFEALLPGALSVRTDLDRADRTEFAAITAFGGAPIKPRAIKKSEAKLLTTMRQRNYARGGGSITLSVPSLPTTNLRGAGWLDWNEGVAYVSMYDANKPKESGLIRADASGVVFLTKKIKSKPAAQPPLPPPSGSWQFQAWSQRVDARGALDVDLLIGEALAAAYPSPDDADTLTDRSSWLRKDKIGSTPVTVFEIAKPQEHGMARGQARLRYWVDKWGGLRRLEVRTRTGAFGQLDIKNGEVPDLPLPQQA